MMSDSESIPAGDCLLSNPEQACLAAGLQIIASSEPTSLLRLNVVGMPRLIADLGPEVERAVVGGVAEMLKEEMCSTAAIEQHGSDNFAVLFQNTPLEAVLNTANNAQQRIETTSFENSGRPFHITLAGGLAVQHADEDLTALAARANAALHGAQTSGTRQLFWHDGSQVRHLEAAEFLRATLPAAPPQPTVVAHDESLTDLRRLCGRTTFCQNLRRFLQAANASEAPLAALLVKACDFDALAARRGPRAAELVLAAVLQMLRNSAFKPVLLGRYAPHTISLLLCGLGAMQAETHCAEFERTIAATVFLVEGEPVYTRLRLGLAQALPRDDMPSLITRAESDLHQARKIGVPPTASAMSIAATARSAQRI